MSQWSEEDSATYAALAEIAVPRRREMMATLVAAIPFARDEPFRMVELGAGQGLLAEAVLDAFPAATLLALDGSASMRLDTVARTARFGARAAVRNFALDAVDWWDLMRGVDLVMSSLCLHHLNDAKKQYLYKAVADRLSARGALIVADLIDPATPASREIAADAWDRSARDQADAIGQPQLYQKFVETGWNHFRTPDEADHPSALLHHLVWLKQAGFLAADGVWLFAGHAVLGGFGVNHSRRSM
jgi:tRNA (cmo5U34)-methyltransferase